MNDLGTNNIIYNITSAYIMKGSKLNTINQKSKRIVL